MGVSMTGQEHASLLALLAIAVQHRMGDFNLQAFADTASELAIVGQADASLFASLATAAKCRTDNFKPQELDNTACTLATTAQADMHCCLESWLQLRSTAPASSSLRTLPTQLSTISFVATNSTR